MFPAENYRVLVGKYGEKVMKDVWAKAAPMIGNGWRLTRQGKMVPMFPFGPAIDTPWCHAVVDKERDCMMWHRILFDTYGLLPSPCLECWKIVIRPKTLVQLFDLYELEKEMGYPSKCGIEVRTYVHGLYGGYFYTGSLDEGQQRWREVKDAVSERIDPDIPVILKRACTEFELKFGPSNNWRILDEQLEMEEAIYELFDYSETDAGQPETVVDHVKARWIEWAYQCGDPTYAEYTDGKPIYPTPVVYHDLDLSALQKKEQKMVVRRT